MPTVASVSRPHATPHAEKPAAGAAGAPDFMALFQAMVDASQTTSAADGLPADQAPDAAQAAAPGPQQAVATGAIAAPGIQPAMVDGVVQDTGVPPLPVAGQPPIKNAKLVPGNAPPPPPAVTGAAAAGPAAVLALTPQAAIAAPAASAQTGTPAPVNSAKQTAASTAKPEQDGGKDDTPPEQDADVSSAALLVAAAAVPAQPVTPVPTTGGAAQDGNACVASEADITAQATAPVSLFAAAGPPAIFAGLPGFAAARAAASKSATPAPVPDATPEMGEASSDAPLPPASLPAKQAPSPAHPGAAAPDEQKLAGLFVTARRNGGDAPRKDDASAMDTPSTGALFGATGGTAPAAGTTTAASATATSAGPAAPGSAPQPPVPLAGVPVLIAGKALAGEHQFDIRLDPPELGRIEVRLKVGKDGQISSHLVADRADTLNLLRRDEAGLQRALQDAGLKTGGDGLQFSLRDHSGGQTDGRAAPRLIREDDTALPVEHAPRSYVRYSGRLGGLDIRI